MPVETRTLNGIQIYLEYENLEKVQWNQIKDNPKKIPYVIMHGHSANHFFMKPLFDYVKSLGHPVLMFDLRGHGWSQKEIVGRFKLDDTVEDLYAIYQDFLLKEFGYQQFHLSGHSMGGFIAQKYILKYPQTINKFILLATGANPFGNPLRKIGLKVVIRGFKNNYWKWFNMKKKQHEVLGIEFFPQWEDRTLLPSETAVIEFMEDMANFNALPELHKIYHPTWICIGKKDGTFTQHMAKEIHREIPNSQLRILPNVVHNLTIQIRDRLGPMIGEFLYNS